MLHCCNQCKSHRGTSDREGASHDTQHTADLVTLLLLGDISYPKRAASSSGGNRISRVKGPSVTSAGVGRHSCLPVSLISA